MNSSPRIRRTRDQQPKSIPKRVLSVRMYDVGFGDCFLLRIPTTDGKNLKVLFDCGSIKQGAMPLEKVIQQVIADVRDDPRGPARIDVVVATHRHRDHVSGFANPAWGEVEVREVWMPWTEQPDDPQARHIRDTQAQLAAQLERRLALRLTAAADPETPMPLKSSLEMARNAMSNENAMRTLYQGFAGQPVRRYLPKPGDPTPWFTVPVLSGVPVFVLGPSRDPKIILDLDPPGGQSYLKWIESGNDGQTGHPKPFSEDWVVTTAEYESQYPILAQRVLPLDRTAVQNTNVGLEEELAATLDKALNGTSLMLVFQIDGATLLFPGDAQWGTWNLALENPDFRKLLKATNYYKVGHHGSHNATPVEFVEQVLGSNFWAMVSTHQMDNWPKIPKIELLEKLTQKPGSKIVRSDQPQEATKPGFSVDNDGVIEARIPF